MVDYNMALVLDIMRILRNCVEGSFHKDVLKLSK